jgi:hypothetical protein
VQRMACVELSNDRYKFCFAPQRSCSVLHLVVAQPADRFRRSTCSQVRFGQFASWYCRRREDIWSGFSLNICRTNLPSRNRRPLRRLSSDRLKLNGKCSGPAGLGRRECADCSQLLLDGQQEIDPTWYDPWAAPNRVVAQHPQPRTASRNNH